MKKKLLSILLTAAMATTVVSGTALIVNADSESDLSGKTFAIVIRNSGNPYAEKEADGFKQVIEAAGGECIIKSPEKATADAQIPLIQSLISQEVDAIAIASNDVNALTACLQDAMDEGIKVLSLDSNVVPEARQTFVNQAGVTEIGQALADAVYDISGGSGEFAILSASSQ